MANNKMLIDAAHPEETRVVVLRDGRVEEFDYESAAKKLLRGNIYLAKVTRVEPSLQAAFIEYGGNRHGFLAFNEIHPDYYQIPIADRQALLREEALSRDDEDDNVGDDVAEAPEPTASDDGERAVAYISDVPDPDGEPEEIGGAGLPYGDDSREGDATRARREMALKSEPDQRIRELPVGTDDGSATTRGDETARSPDESHADQPPGRFTDRTTDTSAEPAGPAVRDHGPMPSDDDAGPVEVHDRGHGGGQEAVESVGAEDALEEVPERRQRRQRARSYKIQEVIKRRQIILVQVVKEERGSKGAALTTYLSLAGRYTVLMPNTGRGGGISRKITDPADRKRLKKIAQELEVPEGMGLIIRTAGASRTKADIKRDFEYLLRLWESIRDLTLQSQAPALVYAEGDLIKRSIRDLYTKDIDEILVAGDAAYRDASDFMRMLMPSHVRSVIDYKEPEPLFNRFQIERQLNAMFSPYVTLRSGGYIVINQTEALVSIDVNSGRSTREFSIEETALNTNLEASDEIARQLKLRDLAGLIVIDFIDMEEKRNNRAVERRLKEALRFDRARIQVGRISHFGLMEMSRQRLRTGVLEGSTSQCPHCQGTGVIRSTESVALAVLRALEDALMTGERGSPLTAETTAEVALYILNEKRVFINDMEARYALKIVIQANARLQGANFQVQKAAVSSVADVPAKVLPRAAVRMDRMEYASAEPAGEQADTDSGGASANVNDDRRGRRKRRRRGRGRDREEGGQVHGTRGPASFGDGLSGGDYEGGDDRDGSAGDDAEPAVIEHAEIENAGRDSVRDPEPGRREHGRHDRGPAHHGRDGRPPRDTGGQPATADVPFDVSDQPFIEDEVAADAGPDRGRPDHANGHGRGDSEESGGRRRRRGRRGGRRGRDRGERGGEPAVSTQGGHPAAVTGAAERDETVGLDAAVVDHGEAARPRQPHPRAYTEKPETLAPPLEPERNVPLRAAQPVLPAAQPQMLAAEAEPVVEKRPRAPHHHPADAPLEVPHAQPTAVGDGEFDGTTAKRGWWQRRFGG